MMTMIITVTKYVNKKIMMMTYVAQSKTTKAGSEPVEAEMFDRDGYGNVQVALLPHETLHLPFTFMTLSLFSPTVKKTSWRGRQRQSHKCKWEVQRFVRQ